jgi:hypothetical protein
MGSNSVVRMLLLAIVTELWVFGVLQAARHGRNYASKYGG